MRNNLIHASEPKYLRIAKDIANQNLRTGNYLAPEVAYARQYCVSRLTVRRALGHLEQQGLISPVRGKQRQVLQDFARLPQTLTFACLGAGLPSAPGQNVFGNYFYWNTFKSLAYEFQQKSISLLPVAIDPEHPDLPAFLADRHIDAYIVMGAEWEFIDRLPTPTIVVDDSYLSKARHAICIDGKAIGMEAVNYLYDRGHRVIVCLGCAPDILYPFFDDVCMGYERGLLMNSTACCPVVLPLDAATSAAGPLLERFVRDMLKSHPGLDALIVCSNDLAIRVNNVLKKIGRHVPRDISLVAVGGTEDSTLCDPPLTGFENDLPVFAGFCRDYILQVVSGAFATLPGKLQVKVFKLIERESVVCRPTSCRLPIVAGRGKCCGARSFATAKP